METCTRPSTTGPRQTTRLYEVVDPRNPPAPHDILWGTNDLPQAIEYAAELGERQGWQGIEIQVSDPTWEGWELKATLRPEQIQAIRAQLAELIH